MGWTELGAYFTERHRKWAEIRKAAALHFLQTRDVEGTCEKFKISVYTLTAGVREAGGRMYRGQVIPRPRSFLILKDLLNGIPPLEVASKHSVTKAWVYRILNRAKEAGWPELEQTEQLPLNTD